MQHIRHIVGWLAPLQLWVCGCAHAFSSFGQMAQPCTCAFANKPKLGPVGLAGGQALQQWAGPKARTWKNFGVLWGAGPQWGRAEGPHLEKIGGFAAWQLPCCCSVPQEQPAMAAKLWEMCKPECGKLPCSIIATTWQDMVCCSHPKPHVAALKPSAMKPAWQGLSDGVP